MRDAVTGTVRSYSGALSAPSGRGAAAIARGVRAQPGGPARAECAPTSTGSSPPERPAGPAACASCASTRSSTASRTSTTACVVGLDRAGRVISVSGSPVPDPGVASAVPELSAAEAMAALQRDVGSHRRLKVVEPARGTRRVTGFGGRDAAQARALPDRLRDAPGLAADAACELDRLLPRGRGRHERGPPLPREPREVRRRSSTAIRARRTGRSPRTSTPYLSQYRLAGAGGLLQRHQRPDDGPVLVHLQRRRLRRLPGQPGARRPDGAAGAPGLHPDHDFAPVRLHAGLLVRVARGRPELVAGQLRARRHPGAVVRGQLPRPPGDRPDRLHRRGRQLRVPADPVPGQLLPVRLGALGPRRDQRAGRRRPRDGRRPGRGPPQQREHAHAAGRRLAADADVPVRHVGAGSATSTATTTPAPSTTSTRTASATASSSTRTASGALNSPHAGAMGEGWSDWYALDYLNRATDEHPDTPAPGEVDIGYYSDKDAHATRYNPIDCPVGTADPKCPGGVASGPAASPSATSARSTPAPRSTPTARSGWRRCGTCAAP